METTDPFVTRTIELARVNVEEGGKPFACLVVRDGEVLAESPNRVAQTGDPTAHAEILAIRDACTTQGSPDLSGCEIYVLALPCPMCLGALHYCAPDRVIFVVTREDYVPYYRDDGRYFEVETFYDEFAKPWDDRRLPTEHRPDERGLDVYRRFAERAGEAT